MTVQKWGFLWWGGCPTSCELERALGDPKEEVACAVCSGRSDTLAPRASRPSVVQSRASSFLRWPWE